MIFTLRCTIGLTLTVFAADPAGLEVARELHREGDYHGAAIEFRRLARASEGEERGGYYWAAAHEYGLAHHREVQGKMLDRAEDAESSLSSAAMLLRAENARETRQFSDAMFYYEGLYTDDSSDQDLRKFSGLRLASLHLRQGESDKSLEILSELDAAGVETYAAVSEYSFGHDKKPRVGGLLGLVPGLGYAYSGEYANAMRSLILNGLFIWGMVETAEDEEWGTFAVISFFEITWYSGSIYGGIDAAHRYNRNRLQQAEDQIMQDAAFEPDYSVLPSVTLEFRF